MTRTARIQKNVDGQTLGLLAMLMGPAKPRPVTPASAAEDTVSSADGAGASVGAIMGAGAGAKAGAIMAGTTGAGAGAIGSAGGIAAGWRGHTSRSNILQFVLAY